MFNIIVKSGFEIIAVVEDLKTLRSTAAVLVYADDEDGKRLFEHISMIEV